MKHTYIFENYYGITVPHGFQIDHINGDKSNNSITNLRMVDRYQNNQNKRIRKDNTSGFTGVYKQKNGKFKAEITARGNKYRLGTFDTIEEAIKTRERKKRELNNNENCLFNELQLNKEEEEVIFIDFDDTETIDLTNEPEFIDLTKE